MALEGREKPEQLLTAATADVGVGGMAAELPTWLLSGWRGAVGACGSARADPGWGRFCREKQPAPDLARGTARLADGGEEWVCSVRKDLNTEGQLLTQPGEMRFPEDPLAAVPARWPELVLAHSVISSGSWHRSCGGDLLCLELVLLLKEQQHPPDAANLSLCFESWRRKKEELAWVMEQGFECCRWA